MEFTTVSELARKPWSVLIYGMPKSGKTVFAAGAPAVLIIETDPDGEISLRNHDGLDVKVAIARDYKAVVKIIRQIKKDKPKEIKTICIDTISSLQQSQRLDLIDSDDAMDKDRWVFNQNIYSVNNFKINLVVRELLGLKDDYNLLLTCHLKEDISNKDGTVRIIQRPHLSPECLSQVYAGINGIYCLEKEGEQRKLTVKGNRLQLADGRYKIDKAFLPNPTFDSLRRYLER